MSLPASPPLVLERGRLHELLELLCARGYRVIGPRARDGALVYDELESIESLPEGLTELHAPGRARLAPRDDARLFGFATGTRSFRPFFQAPVETLVTLRRGADGGPVSVVPVGAAAASRDERPLALFGARDCDLRALAVTDRVLAEGEHPDVRYVARRRGTFVVAVNCTEPSSTCFCVSMGGGPRAERGYDLSLTELLDGEGHRFVVHPGSERGFELASALGLVPAAARDLGLENATLDGAASQMGRTFDERGVREALLGNLEHPAWNDVAERCLACGNCTLACPTCFCSTLEDSADVTSTRVERHVRHDSCFTREHSYVHGGPVRASVRARYRQWLTHKFATWYDQFGSSGCVGCGRCITVCPVGIDVTEEIARIRRGSNAS